MTTSEVSFDGLRGALPVNSYLSVLLYSLPLCGFFFLYFWLSKWLVRKLDTALSKLNAIGASILRRKDDAIAAAEGPTAYRADWHESILLPNQTEPIQRVGMDIGGSLAKLVYFQPNPTTSSLAESQEVMAGEDDDLKERVIGGKLRFIKFEVRKLDELIEFMKRSYSVTYMPFSYLSTSRFGSHFRSQMLSNSIQTFQIGLKFHYFSFGISISSF